MMFHRFYKAILLACTFLMISVSMEAQSKPAYTIFTASGKKVSYKKMLGHLSKKDIVLFGEFHNNPIDHWLQLELTKDLSQKRKLALGAEMFEQDNQAAVDAYLQGKLTAKGLDTSARLWSNYKTDYAPLLNYARDNKLVFVATNVPRRYASLVSKSGFVALDSLPARDKAWMAPLPIAFDSTLPGYVKMLEMMPGHANAGNFPRAQALKDATMAYFIQKNYMKGELFLHFNGSYHSDNFEGILWYLKKEMPDLKFATISTVMQQNLAALLAENKQKADYIIVVDEDMTTTY
jgi:uncharacterized iron-regulated protein